MRESLHGRLRARTCVCVHRQVRLFSPSKINVFLRVTARREDGFHDLASLFQVIDHGDHLEVAVDEGYAGPAGGDHRDGDTLLCDDRTIPTDGRNLIIKAFEEFRLRTGRSERFIAHLDKRVHQGAGLGGGSANASTALYAANELCGRVAAEGDLQDWSGSVGSDCPVFFSRGAAFCTGRGEVVVDLTPPPLGPSVPLLLVKPAAGLSTKQIFQALRLESRSEADPEALLGELAAAGDCEQRLCVNDLEAPAFAVMPELGALKTALQGNARTCAARRVRRSAPGADADERSPAGARPPGPAESESGFSAVFMSGSGSTIVCAGSDRRPACLADASSLGPLHVVRANFMTRGEGRWYEAPEV